MKYLVGLLLIMVSADQNLDSYIFNGQDAKDGDFPYHVGLYICFLNRCKYMCGGSLISETFIVTAAHCIDGFLPPEYIVVFLGSRHFLQGTERRVRNKIVHPEWDRPQYWRGNDIGLLEIDHVSYSDTIRSIDLPPFSDLNLSYEAHIAIASGWGRMNITQTLAKILQYTHLLVISNTACAKANQKDLAKEIICAADPDESSGCKGDSGGPLVDMDSKNLIGIVSFGPTTICGNIHFGSAFTRVTSYRQWIYDNTGI